jgi:WD40 repeat protein
VSAAPTATVELLASGVDRIAFAADAPTLAWSEGTGMVHVALAGDPADVLEVGAADTVLDRWALSPGGTMLALVAGSTTRIVGLPGGQTLRTIEGCRAQRFSPDSRLLITESALWNAETGCKLFALPENCDGCELSADSDLAATWHGRDLYAWLPGRDFHVSLDGDRWAVGECTFSPDGHRLIVRGHEEDSQTTMEVLDYYSLEIWNVRDIEGRGPTLLYNDMEGATLLAVSPDGATIAWTDRAGVLQLLDAQEGETLRTDDLRTCAYSLIFSRRGHLAAGIGDAVIVSDPGGASTPLRIPVPGLPWSIKFDHTGDGLAVLTSQDEAYLVRLEDLTDVTRVHPVRAVCTNCWTRVMVDAFECPECGGPIG